MNRGTYRLLALGLLPIVALLVIIGAAGAAPKGGITVDLKVAQSEFRASQDVLVTVTLSNRDEAARADPQVAHAGGRRRRSRCSR